MKTMKKFGTGCVMAFGFVCFFGILMWPVFLAIKRPDLVQAANQSQVSPDYSGAISYFGMSYILGRR